ncbi:MAG: hypothetical protein M9892_07460 [Bacteroidetes bacterium]|nr:hypothetical protein [Bacteroidota bacterium]
MTLERIKEFIDYKGISIKKFEEIIGYSNGAFASQLKRKRSIGVDKLENILSFFPEINPNWLITGEGNMLLSESENGLGGATRTGIPLVGVEAVAGFGNESFAISQSDVLGNYAVPEFASADFMLPITGDSMEPLYKKGDIIACKILHDATFLQWNKPHILATKEQGLLCKRLKPSAKPQHYLAVSENKEYDPFDIPKNQITGIALIIGLIRLE